jgi:hypothetical protein
VAALKDVCCCCKKVRDRKEDAAIAKANAMLDEMMRDGTIKAVFKKQSRYDCRKKQAHTQWEEMNNGRKTTLKYV